MITYHDHLEEELHESVCPVLVLPTQPCIISCTIVYDDHLEEELHPSVWPINHMLTVAFFVFFIVGL